MEHYVTGTGQHIRVHAKEDCKAPEACVIHHPTNHAMREWPTNWRQDRYLMERICPHGVGHPDPDDLAFKATFMHPTRFVHEGTHGCDGCCVPQRCTDEANLAPCSVNL